MFEEIAESFNGPEIEDEFGDIRPGIDAEMVAEALEAGSVEDIARNSLYLEPEEVEEIREIAASFA